MVTRGEIWLVNIDPTVAYGRSRARVCVIVSPPEIHDHLGIVMVAPMKTDASAAPFRPGLSLRGRQGVILLEQMRAIDKSRLVDRLGTVSAVTLKKTLRTLQDFFSEP
jgi:mRNA interferase MazF